MRKGIIKKFKATDKKYGYNLALGGQGGSANKILTENNVMEIIESLKNTNITLKDIGIKYNVSMFAISDINRGKSWMFKNIKYPIRNNGKRKIIASNIVENIINDIFHDIVIFTDCSKV